MHESPKRSSAIATALSAFVAVQAAMFASSADGFGQAIAILLSGFCTVMVIVTANNLAISRVVRWKWLSEADIQLNQLIVAGIVATAMFSHAVVGFWLPIPAWKMFARVPRFDYRFVDGNGIPVNIRDHALKRAYLTLGIGHVGVFGKWFGNAFPERLPLRATVVIESDERRVQKIEAEFVKDENGSIVLNERTVLLNSNQSGD